jgi:hypothetical protein
LEVPLSLPISILLTNPSALVVLYYANTLTNIVDIFSVVIKANERKNKIIITKYIIDFIHSLVCKVYNNLEQ